MRLLHGDCIAKMKALPEASVDAVVCDPPYGLEFMGKKWDNFKTKGGQTRTRCDKESSGVGIAAPRFGTQAPAERLAFEEWTTAWATEALRVLKPGGHLLAFGGSRTHHRLMAGIEDAGFEIRDCLMWLYGTGFPKSLDVAKAVEKAAGKKRAKGLSGWGTALKPAYEPICLARKPLIGTVAENVLTHGTGALNIDECRLGSSGGQTRHTASNGEHRDRWEGNTATGEVTDNGGRWPANVTLDEEAAEMLDAQADASRFFYVAKASRSERNAGCGELEETQQDTARKEGNPGGDNPRNRGVHKRQNHHPTVKPVALMRWLVRLVCPPGGTVLDPFAGSGTTGVACVEEGFECILIEREAEYLPIIRARVKHAEKQMKQLSLGEAK